MAKSKIMERHGRLEDLDRSFDLDFWQQQTATDRFAAAWDMVVFAHKLKGKDESQLRVQRSVENFQRFLDYPLK